MEKIWWKEAVVYQIYPRSFNDSNGDGIGDLPGIIDKLDYIQSLGVDVIWLNPIYGSPNDDNGYDISDYQAIMAEFGSMADFDRLLTGLHERGIKLVMDLVVNHSSDEHIWFVESRKSRDNPYRDYYHWWPAENGKPAPRWSFFDKDGDAWKYDETTNAYYLHYFSEKQPDLNWEHEPLRRAIYDMMHFWFQKGIDGFRMDVITFISKDTTFPPIPDRYQGKMWDYFYASGPRLHEYLQEMNREVLSKYDVMTVAEGPGTSTETILDLVAEDRHELNMAYHFDIAYLGLLPRKMISPTGWNLVEFKAIQSRWDAVFAERGWGTIYLGNHDQPRMVSRWGNDSPAWRELSSKMLTTFILSMRGTPYYYQGDELGMSNIRFDRIEDYRDLETIGWHGLVQREGGDLTQFIESHKVTARDNGRTPMQWDNSANAGFTTGTPWLSVNPNYPTVNVATEEADPASCLHYFRKMVRLRRENDVLIYGQYALLDAANPQVYAYTRTWEGRRLLVLLNFSAEPATATIDLDLSRATVLIGNYPSNTPSTEFRPYEAVIYDL
ncbi:glycoside hydrolase family 13 protein [Spirosoma rhododendri]|uniref:glycoside hydrolase family 13 protein n=1 Tax=Spirosoma rhododendri TaxID=2728024 RepID=UPI0015834D2D|nr:alpha-glucosidase [Spirosoma rhododendri]